MLIFVQETCDCVRCNGDISRNDGLGMVSVCETRCVERRRQIKQRAISSLGWERELASRERTSNTLLTVRRTLRRRRHPTDLGKTSCSRRALIWASPNAASASTTGAGQRLSDWICLNTLKTVLFKSFAVCTLLVSFSAFFPEKCNPPKGLRELTPSSGHGITQPERPLIRDSVRE